jgi:N-acetylglucosamine-6-sulfatase
MGWGGPLKGTPQQWGMRWNGERGKKLKNASPYRIFVSVFFPIRGLFQALLAGLTPMQHTLGSAVPKPGILSSSAHVLGIRARLFAALLMLLASTTASEAAPNIVVIMTDDQEDTGSVAYMPKLRTLIAEQGLTFINSFVDCPLCAPSRASFFTGQAAHNTGIKANNPLDEGGWEAFKTSEDKALPVWLKKAGYKTALLGKYLNRYGQQSTSGAWLAWAGNLVNVQLKGATIGNPRDWVPPGWDLWYAFTGSRARYFDYQVNENGTILKFGSRPTDYSTDVLERRAVRFIFDQSGNSDPFFLLIATKAAHDQGKQAIPAPQYAEAFKDVGLPMGPSFNRKNGKELPRESLKAPTIHGVPLAQLTSSYHAELQSLQSVDDLVASVVDALKQTGKLDDTVIIYTSDNGFIYGEHRLIGKSAAYEEAIKVPLLMRGPGIPKNERRSELVNNLDVVATIAELAGASPQLTLDGHSLTSLFADANAPWRSAILIESPVSHVQKLSARFIGVRTATRKYVKHDNGFEELFDLEADPSEIHNEASNPTYARDLAMLRNVEERLKSCVGRDCLFP